MRYLALLRGINVGGKNKVSMAELKQCFERLDFTNVSTYINSGNIFFETAKTDEAKLVKICEEAIEKSFGFKVIITVISKTDFESALQHAPEWWGDGERKEIRSDALFIIPPVSGQEALKHIAANGSVVDRFAVHGQIIFWSLPMVNYNQSVVPKIIGTPIYKSITIRSSTTTKKLANLFDSHQ